MNLDKAIEAIEQGFKAPETIIRRVQLKAEELAQHGLRRKGEDLTFYVWMITVGERGANPSNWFIDHKLTKAMKKALEWRGVPPIKRPRKANGSPQQQPTG